MYFFRSNPFIRLLIPFIIGILAHQYLSFSNYVLLICCLLFIVFEVLLYSIKINYKAQWYFGVGITGFVFCCSLLLCNHTQNPATDFFNKKQQLIQATSLNIPKESTNSYAIPIHINAIKLKNIWQVQDFESIAYFEKDSAVATLKAGQNLVIKIKIDSIQSNLNPFGFDYASYMSFNQVNHSAYIKSNEWHALNNNFSSIKTWALNLRQKVLHIYEKNGIEGDELAVFSALTIGYKNTLNSTVKDAYAGAGAMHIMAVSGMHAAILFSIFFFLFKKLGIIKPDSRIPYFIILILLWAYAFISGLSPSITRASIMASFMLLGKATNKHMNVYNSLAAAAFFMLCYNPYYLFQVGFQLSFIAVLSIVIFHNKIHNTLYVKNRTLNYIWELTAVSLAAQIGTFPLSIYYFNQFPSYFWLSGAFTVLAAQILMSLAILISILGAFGLHFALIGKGISYVTLSLNKMVFAIYKLPFSTIAFFDQHPITILLLFILIISIHQWITSKTKGWLFACLICLLFIGSINSFQKLFSKQYNKIAVYHINRKTAIQLINNDVGLWIVSDTTDKQIQTLQKDAANYWQIPKANNYSYHLNDTINATKNNIRISNNFIKVGNQTAFILKSETKLPVKILDKIPINYLIITQKPSYSINDLNKIFSYDHIIIDGSVSVWKHKFWRSKTSPPHYVSKAGAFIQSFHY